MSSTKTDTTAYTTTTTTSSNTTATNECIFVHTIKVCKTLWGKTFIFFMFIRGFLQILSHYCKQIKVK